MKFVLIGLVVLVIGAGAVLALGGDSGTEQADTNEASQSTTSTEQSTEQSAAASADAVEFTAEVWADNWFALYVNGVLVGEDSVPITTERSFNSETITFSASYPLTVAIEAKDFKETDSGIEYIGAANQQMGDGGIFAQITDNSTGEVVAVTDSTWQALAVHRAPLNKDCETSADPDSECQTEIIESPFGWETNDFSDADWSAATEWSEADVSPKDGYNEITWDTSAQLIWGSDLEIDNTVLLRASVIVQ